MTKALLDVTFFNGAATTEGDQKNYIAALHAYLIGLFGADGTKATAISTLGASPFPAGTKMLFPQAAAPTGWTKDTTHNDKSLRVVSGTGGGSGGSVAFSTVFGRTSVDGTSLSIAQIPSHYHNMYKFLDSGANNPRGFSTGKSDQLLDYPGMSSAGSGAAHAHGLDLRVQYVDVIIARKD